MAVPLVNKSDTFGIDLTPGFSLGAIAQGIGDLFGGAPQKVSSKELEQYYGPSKPANKPGNTSQSTGSSTPSLSYASSSAPSYDPNVLSQYQTAINTTQSALDRLPNQLAIAKGNIGSQYNTNLNELNSSKKQAQGSYDTSTLQNRQNYRGDKNQIADAASSGLRGLLRTLGAYGAGGSSDALYVAPQAVAQQASAERAGAGQNYAQNAQSLDTNWNNFLEQDKNSREKLNDWRTQQINSATAQSDTTKQSLLSKLADLMGQKAAYQGGSYQGAAQPLIDQANDLSGTIDNLARINPSYNGTTPVYDAPTLGSYEVNPNTQTQFANAAEQTSTPYLSLLLGGRDRNQLGF